MCKALKEIHDFKYEKTKVESMISARGHDASLFQSIIVN